MKCKLVKLNKFSGNKASVYSVYISDEGETLFDIFIKENINLFKSEILDIVKRLNGIVKYTGARIEFFKDWEGKPGDGVCALYDSPQFKLRLYCIRYGADIIILGGGGYKPKSISALQEDQKLKDENYFSENCLRKSQKEL